MTKARYWSLDCDGDTRRGRFHVEQVDGQSKWPWRSRFRAAQRMGSGEWPSPPPQIRADVDLHKKKPIPAYEDMPWSGLSEHIVSDRLRAFLEAEAPGVAEYLPVEFTGPGSEACPHRYWVVNWLSEFECLDEEASMNEDDNGKFVEVPVIDTSRIPAHGLLGVLKGYRVVVLIRNDLRLKMIKSGFIGPQFSSIAHSDGTDFQPFIKPGATGGPGKLQFPTKLPKKKSGAAADAQNSKVPAKKRTNAPNKATAKKPSPTNTKTPTKSGAALKKRSNRE